MLFMTDAYFEHDIDFKTELKSMMEFYQNVLLMNNTLNILLGLNKFGGVSSKLVQRI